MWAVSQKHIIIQRVNLRYPRHISHIFTSLMILYVNTYWFHNSNMLLSDQRSLLLTCQILVTVDSIYLFLQLLLSSCNIMVSLHE